MKSGYCNPDESVTTKSVMRGVLYKIESLKINLRLSFKRRYIGLHKFSFLTKLYYAKYDWLSSNPRATLSSFVCDWTLHAISKILQLAVFSYKQFDYYSPVYRGAFCFIVVLTVIQFNLYYRFQIDSAAVYLTYLFSLFCTENLTCRLLQDLLYIGVEPTFRHEQYINARNSRTFS